MKQRLHHYIALMLVIIGMMACSGTQTKPHLNNSVNMDMPFTQAYAIYYGPFYEDIGIESHVFEMAFYTEGLAIDSAGYLVGTGYHLYVTDLFAVTSDSIPPQGSYHIDSINYGNPFTMMPGKRMGDFSTGVELTQVGNEYISTHLMTDGTLQLQWQGDTAHIQISMRTDNNGKVESSYTGKLPIYYVDYTFANGAKSKRNKVKVRKRYVL